MDEYSSSHRLYPLWAVLSLTIPIGLGAWGVSAARGMNTLAGTPLFALFAYGLAVGYLNRVWVRVTADGISTGFGPLPCGVHPIWVARDDIAKVYLRLIPVAADSEQTPHWAAGVERIDGQWFDLTDPLAAAEAVRESAQEIALTLQWTEPIQLLRAAPPNDYPKRSIPLRMWGALVAAAIVWAALYSR